MPVPLGLTKTIVSEVRVIVGVIVRFIQGMSCNVIIVEVFTYSVPSKNSVTWNPGFVFGIQP